MHDKAWKALPAQLVGQGPGTVDVSVFAAQDYVFRAEGEKFSNEANLIYGQDAYFLGFPFGQYGDLGDLMSGFPMPYVKRAILSGIPIANGPMVLDGINNIGFSGGPVLARQGEGRGELSIVGVISGYQAIDAKVFHRDNDTGLIVRENSGLISASHIARAHELIDANPIGRLL